MRLEVVSCFFVFFFVALCFLFFRTRTKEKQLIYQYADIKLHTRLRMKSGVSVPLAWIAYAVTVPLAWTATCPGSKRTTGLVEALTNSFTFRLGKRFAI